MKNEEHLAARANRLEIGGLVDGAVDRDGGFLFEVVAETRVEPVRCHAAALIEAAAAIGPPVSAFLAASSLKDNGAKSTTLLPADSLPAGRKIRSVFACVIVCSHGTGRTPYGKEHDDDRTSQTGGEREA
jgi:hypothetical protein